MGNFLRRSFLVSLTCVLCSSCLTGIHVLGIDESGAKDLKITKSKYSKRIGETLADLHDSALGPANAIAYGRPEDEWKIEWFNIGLGIEGKVGLAGIATLSARPRIRLYFKRKSQ